MADQERPMPRNHRAEAEARDWLVRLTAGTTQPEDLERFRVWRSASDDNERAFARERLAWQQTQWLEADFAAQGVARAVARSGRRRRGLGLTAAALAACLAVAVMFSDIITRLKADYVTRVGEQATYTLPDGSVAYLNSGSAIALRYQSGLRLVTLLRGEAYFEVKKDPNATFRVAAAAGQTDAVGTAFAVRHANDEVTVTVTEGVVRVTGVLGASVTADQTVRVNTDQQTRYGAGTAPVVSRIDAADATAWRNGNIVFDGKPFHDAVHELGRYLPERVVLMERARDAKPVSGMFSVREPQNAIEALAATQHLTVTRIPHVMLLIR